jgi:hypothetical protein
MSDRPFALRRSAIKDRLKKFPDNACSLPKEDEN